MRSREFLHRCHTWVAPGVEVARGPGESATSALLRLSRRDSGEPIRSHRSSWTRRIDLDGRPAFAKTYDYPTWNSRRRGLFRNTAFARSRVEREFQAIRWLREHGFRAAEPLAVGTWRSGPFLRRALLVTAAIPGRSIDDLWPELGSTERDELRRVTESELERLHRHGFRDRNPDPRNWIVEAEGDSFRITKIDSPRFVLRPASSGSPSDRLARADRARLAAGFEALGHDRPTAS